MVDLQSAYCANHSTETAMLRVLSDILGALDRGDFAVLTLLDLPAAFDHSTLLRRPKTIYGICETVLGWFKSYLHNRQQSVRGKNDSSTPALVEFGVPQGSVLGRSYFCFILQIF